MKPKLEKSIDPEQFLNYYWLKVELVAFCKDLSIPRNGSKQELTDRIYHYLTTGKILKTCYKTQTKRSGFVTGNPTLESKISDNYKNDATHRAFFKKVIGKHFKFNVPFIEWIKNTSDKTYLDAVNEWKRIYQEKQSGKRYKIASQFKFNQYFRDFFLENPTLSRDDAITCWKHKKSLPTSNLKYETADLEILMKKTGQ